MAIGKLLPVLLRRYAPAHRPDRRFAAGELGHLGRIRLFTPIRLEIIRGLVTPPLPFAEAERKADPNGIKHNTVPCKLPTAQIEFSHGLTPRLGFGHLEPEPAGAALTERFFQFGKDSLELTQQRPGWIDDQEPGGGER